MGQSRYLHPSDLRGLAQLGVNGVTATTELVEHLHHSITRVPGVRRVAEPPRTRGITGLVYRAIHGVTGVVGQSLDVILGAVATAPARGRSAPARARALAILNGVIGDHLEASGNPLATPMALLGGDGTTVDDTAAAENGAASADRVAVFLHGLCMDERCWQPPADRDSAAHLPGLIADEGWSVAHVRYNTGRHIHANGRDLEGLLERLVTQSEAPPRELALIGHSMGGLVARSALHQAQQRRSAWADKRPIRLVFLGAPHHGSPVERAGHGIDRLLGVSRYSAPFARLGKMRSAGITDLRHGNVLAGDAAHDDRFHPAGDTRNPTRLPAGATCFAIAATLDRDPATARSRYVGDGWVPVPSALGWHDDPRLRLPVAPARTMVLTETGHLELLHHPEVARRVLGWLN